MACINCGERGAMNFAVGDRTSEREVGHLCPQCLIDEYGLTILDENWRNADGCAICHRDGTFRFHGPGVRRTPADADGAAVVEYDLDDHSLEFCDEHYHRLLDSRHRKRRAIADGGNACVRDFDDRYR